jgi:hypothetical protein
MAERLISPRIPHFNQPNLVLICRKPTKNILQLIRLGEPAHLGL